MATIPLISATVTEDEAGDTPIEDESVVKAALESLGITNVETLGGGVAYGTIPDHLAAMVQLNDGLMTIPADIHGASFPYDLVHPGRVWVTFQVEESV